MKRRRGSSPRIPCDRDHGRRPVPATHVLRALVPNAEPGRGDFTHRLLLCGAHAFLEVVSARFWRRAHRVAAYRFRRLP